MHCLYNYAGASDEDFDLPMIADALEGAFSGVQSYISRTFPNQYVLPLARIYNAA